MSDGTDRLIEQVRETLQRAPGAAPDQRAVGRLLQKVWESPRPSAWRRWVDSWRVPAVSAMGATAVAVFALLAGFVTRGAVEMPGRDPLSVTGDFPAQAPGTPVQLAANVSAENAPVQTQFVFDRKDAASVSLVGDFNEWQGGETPLTRLESGLWTVSVPLVPGRHVYAFLVDGRLVVADPRAPKSGDADYGREGSVVMVFAR